VNKIRQSTNEPFISREIKAGKYNEE